MNQQSAAALVMYLNRAIGIIPTTGMEWNAISEVLPLIEQIANGRATVKVEPKPAAQPVEQKDEEAGAGDRA